MCTASNSIWNTAINQEHTNTAAKIKQPTNIQYFSEHDLKLRSKIAKIYYFLNLLVIGFYVAAFVLVSFYPYLFKRAV